MADDSFRGTCINCGQPVVTGRPCFNCQDALIRKASYYPSRYEEIYGSSKKTVATMPYVNEQRQVLKNQKEIRDVMNGVQVCERCGSIGQARDFVSLSASSMNGNSLHMPELITMAQLEKMQEDDADLEYQSNYVLCRNCKTACTSFLHNIPTDSGQAGPIQPKLPKPSGPTPAGQPTTSTGQSGES